MISDIIKIFEENSLWDLFTKEDLDTLIDNEGETLNNDIKSYERLLPVDCSINIVESLIKLSMKLHSNTNWKQNFTEHVVSLPPKYCRTSWDSVYEFIKHFLKNIEGFKKVFGSH